MLLLLVAAALAGAGAVLVVQQGWYDVSATGAHTQPVHDLLEGAMHRSVRARAVDIAVPADLAAPARIGRGAVCYRDACVQCHGGPGVAPQPFAMSLQPLPGPLFDAARRWRPQELYWITRHGIKMSGMPAWAFRIPEQDLWAVVAFLQRLPHLSPKQYADAMQAVAGQTCPSGRACEGDACPADHGEAVPAPGPDARASRAPLLLRQYACTACHRVPGVVGSKTNAGPPLDGLWRRSLIAGKVPRTEEDLARWIQHPRQIDPETAMPDMGVTQAHAREIAAFLLQPR